jgi:hemerythrin-like domain-containing protein
LARGLLCYFDMKATELLTNQHREVSRLFKAIESAEEKAKKRQLFMELASKLVAHDGIERDIFYPACEEAMGMNDLLGEALVEHGMIEFAVYQATEAMEAEDFDFKCKVLSEMVEHHVEEEEKEFFPRVEKELGEDSLNLLGEEMEEAFEDALLEDFRRPLYNNLKQVFAGALKTVPADDPDSEKTEIKRKGASSSGQRKRSKSA